MPKRTNKVLDKVISFRLTLEEIAEIQKKITDKPVLLASSPGKLARMLLKDWTSGLVAYTESGPMLMSPEARRAQSAAPAAAVA